MLSHNRFRRQTVAEVKLWKAKDEWFDLPCLRLTVIVTLWSDCTHGMAWAYGIPVCSRDDSLSDNEAQTLEIHRCLCCMRSTTAFHLGFLQHSPVECRLPAMILWTLWTFLCLCFCPCLCLFGTCLDGLHSPVAASYLA